MRWKKKSHNKQSNNGDDYDEDNAHKGEISNLMIGKMIDCSLGWALCMCLCVCVNNFADGKHAPTATKSAHANASTKKNK